MSAEEKVVCRAFEMELVLLPSPPLFGFPSKATRNCKPEVQRNNDPNFWCPCNLMSLKQRMRGCQVTTALPETAASIVLAGIAVGASATLLARRAKASKTSNISFKVCEDCAGSGICAECNGEGFVLKKMIDGSAEKARMTAKNMATRYTAGLPKKWSYCSKCSSARSCSTCGGSGRIST